MVAGLAATSAVASGLGCSVVSKYTRRAVASQVVLVGAAACADPAVQTGVSRGLRSARECTLPCVSAVSDTAAAAAGFLERQVLGGVQDSQSADFDRLEAGTWARVVGLQVQQQLNGMLAEVLCFVAARQRYKVRIFCEDRHLKLAVRESPPEQPVVPLEELLLVRRSNLEILECMADKPSSSVQFI